MDEENRREDMTAKAEETMEETTQEHSEEESKACETPADTEETKEKEEALEEKEPEKKGFFGKKKEKKDPRDAQIEELNDKVRRNLAEFDNYRKRTEKEKSAMFEIGAKDIVERILPVIDNFERGLTSIPEEAKGTPFANGMEMIYKQLLKNLEEAGVKPIEAVGQPFDPNFHNAVMHIEDENLG